MNVTRKERSGTATDEYVPAVPIPPELRSNDEAVHALAALVLEELVRVEAKLDTVAAVGRRIRDLSGHEPAATSTPILLALASVREAQVTTARFLRLQTTGLRSACDAFAEWEIERRLVDLLDENGDPPIL